MSEFLFFVIGLMLGGCVSVVLLCCHQINRINEYEVRIRKLKTQLDKQKSTKTQ